MPTAENAPRIDDDPRRVAVLRFHRASSSGSSPRTGAAA